MNYNPKYLLDRKGNPNGKKYIVESKEDGLRGFIICKSDPIGYLCMKVYAYTSSGIKVINAKKLTTIVDKAWKDIKKIKELKQGFVLDGEFLCSNWNDSNSAVKTQTYNPELAKALTFKTWTVIPYSDWKARKCGLAEIYRKVLLDSVIKAIDSNKITRTSYNVYQILTDKIVQRDMKVAIGFSKEGLVIKEYDGLYEFKKCRTWMKLKPYFEADMKIIDAEEECDKHGIPKNALGAVIVKGIIDGKKIKTRCGGGYKRKERIDLWKQHKQGKLVGKIIEMKHEGVTINNAVRFPRFYRMRTDKKVAGKNN
jgi:ATP dependent DNA ligase-like protein/DNA ligase-like protein